MDAEPPPMVPTSLVALIWARARSIPDGPGGWGRFLTAMVAASWAASLWFGGTANHGTGTVEIIDLLGYRFSALWMLAAAVLPIVGLLLMWNPFSLFAAALSEVTWGWLLVELLARGHWAHLSTGTCVAAVLACVRADFRLWQRVFERQ